MGEQSGGDDAGESAESRPGSRPDGADGEVVQICKSCMIARPSDEQFCLECGDELVPIRAVRDSYIGETVGGKYKLVEKIGSGGMGEVYLGVNEPLGQRVAVKFLSRKYTANEQVIMRFLNEARSYCKVSHPNAVTLLDYGQHEDGALYLITEFIEGRSLTDTVHELGQLNPRQAISVASQCCEVLSAAHGQGVIHRDLKPDNIMLIPGKGGRFAVKILDFGIAKIVDEERGQLTKTGSVFGTPEFMSPEQAQGQEADPRSDLYALGIILFYALTARLPFEGDSQFNVLEAHIHEPPPRPSEVREEVDVPMVLEAIISKCLNKEQEGRYEDAESLVQALREARDDLPEDFDGLEAAAAGGDGATGADDEARSGSTAAYPTGFAEDQMDGAEAAGENGGDAAKGDAGGEDAEGQGAGGGGDPFSLSDPDVPATALVGEIDDLGDDADGGADSGLSDVDLEGERSPEPIDFAADIDGGRRPLIGLAVAVLLVGGVVGWNWLGGGGGEETVQAARDATSETSRQLEAAASAIESGDLEAAGQALEALSALDDSELSDEQRTRRRRLVGRLDLVEQARRSAATALENEDCRKAGRAIETVTRIAEPAAATLKKRLEACRRQASARAEAETSPVKPEPDPEPDRDEAPAGGRAGGAARHGDRDSASEQARADDSTGRPGGGGRGARGDAPDSGGDSAGDTSPGGAHKRAEDDKAGGSAEPPRRIEESESVETDGQRAQRDEASSDGSEDSESRGADAAEAERSGSTSEGASEETSEEPSDGQENADPALEPPKRL